MTRFLSRMLARQLMLVGVFALLATFTFGVGTAAAAPSNAMQGQGAHLLVAYMSGSQEVPPADPNATGFATFLLLPDQNLICYTIWVQNIQLPATAAHIHKGAPGVAGPVVVPLTPPNAYGFSRGCASASSDVIMAIAENPGNYYVNVHNAQYPSGADRGQLMSLY